jgi:hypothetical protein
MSAAIVREIQSTREMKGVWFLPFARGNAEEAERFFELRMGKKPEVIYHLGKTFFTPIILGSLPGRGACHISTARVTTS